MKKMLNTLFLTTHGLELHKEGESIQIVSEEGKKNRIPIHAINNIVCFGQVNCTPQFMGFCGENGVSITFLSPNGKFLAKVQGRTSGNVLLRRHQYRLADNDVACSEIARNIVLAKVANSRMILRRFLREHPEHDEAKEIGSSIQKLSGILANIAAEKDIDAIRGKEGEAARLYFEVFDCFILHQKTSFFLHTRSRRPPLDNMNALLSFLYTIMVSSIISAIESVGLDPGVGFLHKERPGRPSLALDMMEEFRSVIADRLALSLVNRKQIAGKGFECTETGAVSMDEDTRKEVISAYQSRKQDIIKHPFTKESVPVGMVFFIQALLMARFIRGDLDGYPPFFWK